MFWVLKRWDGSFEYPQHMFWLRNKKNDICYALLSGLFFMLFVIFWFFFKINFSEKFFQKYHQSVKQFWSRSGSMFVEPDLGKNCLQRLLADNTRLMYSSNFTLFGPLFWNKVFWRLLFGIRIKVLDCQNFDLKQRLFSHPFFIFYFKTFIELPDKVTLQPCLANHTKILWAGTYIVVPKELNFKKINFKTCSVPTTKTINYKW